MKQALQPPFEDQGGIDDRHAVFCLRLEAIRLKYVQQKRVNEAVQILASRFISEDDLAQFATLNLAVFGEDPVSEAFEKRFLHILAF